MGIVDDLENAVELLLELHELLEGELGYLVEDLADTSERLSFAQFV